MTQHEGAGAVEGDAGIAEARTSSDAPTEPTEPAEPTAAADVDVDAADAPEAVEAGRGDAGTAASEPTELDGGEDVVDAGSGDDDSDVDDGDSFGRRLRRGRGGRRGALSGRRGRVGRTGWPTSSVRVRWPRTSSSGSLDIADLDGDIDVDVDGDRAAVAIVDSEEGQVPRRLVGPDGRVLEALQDLTRLAVQAATGERSRLMLDVAGFRAKRRSTLVDQARSAIEKVKSSGSAESLEPMTAFERKVVHDEVAAAGLVSESEGAEPAPVRRHPPCVRSDSTDVRCSARVTSPAVVVALGRTAWSH